MQILDFTYRSSLSGITPRKTRRHLTPYATERDRSVGLQTKSLLEVADAVSCYGELRVLRVFQRDDDFAGEEGVELLNPVGGDEHGAMDAEEAGGVEALFEVGDSLIDGMAAPADDGVSELVTGDEVRHLIEIEEDDALADAGGDAARIVGSAATERGCQVAQ